MAASRSLVLLGILITFLLYNVDATKAAAKAKHKNSQKKVDSAVEQLREKSKSRLPLSGYIMNEWDTNWPSPQVRQALGQIGGVAEDAEGNVFVFHRADRFWDSDDFNEKYSYVRAKYGPIESSTIVILDQNSKILMTLGKNMFYLPHGLSLDPKGNIWVTDVALHQVLKFEFGRKEPTFTLGQALIPGSDNKHFCQPTSVAVAASGEIFVADGYCNSRIMKFAANGTLLHKWGQKRQGNETLSNDHLSVPHGVSLIEQKDLLCVADREHGRVQCYRAGLRNAKMTGQFAFSITNPKFGRVYAVSYNPQYDIILLLGTNDKGSRGYIYSMKTHTLVDNFDYPARDGFGYGHALASSPSGRSLIVGGLTKECPDKEEPACRLIETPLDQNLWRFNMYGAEDLAALL